jgi:antitoxin Phd
MNQSKTPPRRRASERRKEPVWSLQDAKNRFSAVVKAAGAEAQTVTKHGKPAVVVVAADEYARLRKLAKLTLPSFTEHLLAMPKDDGEFERIKIIPRDVEF